MKQLRGPADGSGDAPPHADGHASRLATIRFPSAAFLFAAYLRIQVLPNTKIP